METGFIAAFWFLFVAALVTPLMLGVGFFLRPRVRATGDKSLAYECGEKPVGTPWIRFNIRFYVVAIVFIIFDVELAALFPVATLYRGRVLSGNTGLIFTELFLFIGLLALGLMYCWVSGDLEWVTGEKSNTPRGAK